VFGSRLDTRTVPFFLGMMIAAPVLAQTKPSPRTDEVPAKMTWDFEADEPGRIAKGFTNEVGRWEVAKDGDNHVLAQKAKNDDPIFNVALADVTNFKDLDLSVRMKAVGGETDRGGGLVWRARDKNNCYISR
jgi:hypothetical protein